MSLYLDFFKNDEVRKRDIKKERIVIVKISICKKNQSHQERHQIRWSNALKMRIRVSCRK